MHKLSQHGGVLVTGDRADRASEAPATTELAELGITHAQLRAVPVSQVSGGNGDVCHGFFRREAAPASAQYALIIGLRRNPNERHLGIGARRLPTRPGDGLPVTGTGASCVTWPARG